MYTTLRDMIDGTTIFAGAPKASKPSPSAEHVSKHIQDPLGATKEGFSKLQQKKLEYDQAREEMQRNLAPVQSVVDMASQLHGLTVGNNQTMMPGTPAMGQGTPGAQDNPQLDQDGNPLPPGQDGQPPSMSGMPGKPGGMMGKPAPGNGQNPANMSQVVGKMNNNRPSQAGFSPGVSPMDGQQVRPPKLGVAQPGKPIARNSPSPPGANNPQGNMYNKQAAPPKGNRSLPGAKGPGDPKVQNRTNKAQDKSSRSIKVHVTASAISAIPRDIQAGAVNRLETQLGIASIRAFGPMRPTGGPVARTGGMPGAAPAQGARPGGGVRPPMGSTGGMRSTLSAKKKMKAGPSSLSDKVPTSQDPQNEVAYNPVIRSKGKMVPRIKTCDKCGKRHMGACSSMKSAGHALGAKKGWSIRNKGHVSKVEKAAHYTTMD